MNGALKASRNGPGIPSNGGGGKAAPVRRSRQFRNVPYNRPVSNRGSRERKCDNCFKSGHLAFECQEGHRCFACGQVGHDKAECPSVSKTCNKCGRRGHLASMCRHTDDSDTNLCNNCNEPGHIAKHCDQPAKCFACGSTSHAKADCQKLNLTCDICNKQGHLRAMCRQQPDTKSFTTGAQTRGGIFAGVLKQPVPDPARFERRSCNTCGQYGHWSASCPDNPRSITNKTCDTCGLVGHLRASCPHGQNRTSKTCDTCGQVGHLRASCPHGQSKTCDTCGQVGHLRASCPHGQNRTSKTCDTCGQVGHLRANCPNQTVQTCDNCNKPGHIAKACNEIQRCYGCGSTEHTKADCSRAGLACDRCGRIGHLAVRCRH